MPADHVYVALPVVIRKITKYPQGKFAPAENDDVGIPCGH